MRALHQPRPLRNSGPWISRYLSSWRIFGWTGTAPKAPSVICFEKRTGKVVWSDNTPGNGILHGQYSSPAFAEANGVPLVICPLGDGWLYRVRGTPEPGLALVHTLARRLHASIRAENRPGGGVAFILEFTPAAPAS